MANATNYLENKLIDHIFRAAAFVKPAALYVALYTAAPTDAGGGTEVSGGGYARINLAPGDLNWGATQGGTAGASNGSTFATPAAGWGTVTHFAIHDAATGGNPLVWGPLSVPREILNGDPAPRFPPGTLAITVA